MKTIMPSICIVLWWFICTLLTIDTGLFIYPSLSQTLMGGVCIVVWCIMASVYGLFSKTKYLVNTGLVLLFCWCAYLLVHAAVIADAEIYKLFYLIVSLLFVVSLSQMLRNGWLTFQQIEKGILLMLLIQLACLLLQAMGLMSSYNSFFPLTGFSDNPNSTAIMIAMCLPLIYDRLKTSNHTFVLLALLMVSFVFLIVLKCRTAYVGLSVVLFVRVACSNKFKSLYHRMGRTTAWMSSILLIFTSLSVSVALYKMKQDSSDGRLLVWKVSAEMLTTKPEGWGIGMFERNYNRCQGDYFTTCHSNEHEKALASTVYMAYNDFLEHGVEAGLAGSLFLALFYIILGVKAYKARDIAAFSIICAFMVMSLINFVYASIQAWFVLLCYASRVVGEDRESIYAGTKTSVVIQVVSFFICCLLLERHVELVFSQIWLKNLEEQQAKGEEVMVEDVERLSDHIGTSEGYYKFLSSLYMRDGQYDKAAENLKEALRYTSEPSFFFSLFECYASMDMADEGILYIETVRNMIPQNMMSRNVLLRWYDSQGQTEKALAVAHEMATMPLKIKSPTAERYQKGARWYIENHK